MPEDVSTAREDLLLDRTADVAASYFAQNHTPAADIPVVIASIHRALAGLAHPISIESVPAAAEIKPPAVPVKKSVTPDYIICLEDGKKLKMLKRHIASVYGLTPEEYRTKWGLPKDYPMTAPNYAAARSALAKKIGLGNPSKKRAA